VIVEGDKPCTPCEEDPLPSTTRAARFARVLPLAVLLAASCDDYRAHRHDEDRWLAGDEETRSRAIERQFGGFSRSMMEVGYRYTELYWSAQDGNWELAEYHAEKLGDAIERGIERRPARGDNARTMMLDEPLPVLRRVLATHDRDAFDVAFRTFTESCNQCHDAEGVRFIRVVTPPNRLTPTGPPGTAPAAGDAAPPAGAAAEPAR
jgi:hypothetical protein